MGQQLIPDSKIHMFLQHRCKTLEIFRKGKIKTQRARKNHSGIVRVLAKHYSEIRIIESMLHKYRVISFPKRELFRAERSSILNDQFLIVL